MKTHDPELCKIKDLLRDNPKGMKITRIAQVLGMNRNAAAKYLEILLMTGQVEQLEHGMSKIFILSKRTGIPTMLDRSEDFILILDQDMKITRVNENYLKFTGMNRESILGKRPEMAGLPVIGSPLLAAKIREAHYGADIRTEVREVIGGRESFFTVRLTPTVFNDGTRGITLIIEDITKEKKKLASAADESRNLIQGILSCIEDPVILLDFRTAVVLFINPAARHLFDLPQGESAGNNSGHLPAMAELIPGYPGVLKEIFREQGYYETESRLKRTGGGYFPAHIQVRPICDSKGEVRNMVMVIRNLTVGSGAGPEPAQDTWTLQLSDSSRNRPQYPGISRAV